MSVAGTSVVNLTFAACKFSASFFLVSAGASVSFVLGPFFLSIFKKNLAVVY